jgi:hypothetical protein
VAGVAHAERSVRRDRCVVRAGAHRGEPV